MAIRKLDNITQDEYEALFLAEIVMQRTADENAHLFTSDQSGNPYAMAASTLGKMARRTEHQFAENEF